VSERVADINSVRIEINPAISPDQLFDFYQENDCCEAGYGEEIATRVLQHSSLIVAAFEGEKLVGIARAMFDGLDASIMEFSLALRYQGEDTKYECGSLIEKDPYGIGSRIGRTLIDELLKMGAYFIYDYSVPDCDQLYASLGFKHISGHVIHCIDRRPYVDQAE
jgi:hypothetical protein